ncbi:MAG: dephospho-CoA kinase [Paludibacteraceae bacterium]|nr:dephospho-CoA kinase [Paludibacteraceae bacterium]
MIIGVTGGIGSGKSTVLRAVARLGYPVYDCDAEAKRIIVTDPDVRSQIIATFGDEAYHGGTYNTRYISQQVFANHDKLAKLNAIVHPAVKEDILLQIGLTEKRSNSETVQQAKPVLFIESAILFQAGMADMCDGVAVVTVPEEERIARALHRDRHANREDIIRRIRAQRPPEDYLAAYPKPSIILVNDDDTPHRYLAEQLIQFAQSL